VVYLTQMMKSIDGQYADLLNNRSQGLVWASRANRRLFEMGYDAYKTMSYDGAKMLLRISERRSKASQAI
jgi:hypothetical protein